MPGFGGKAEDISSGGVFRVLTHLRCPEEKYRRLPGRQDCQCPEEQPEGCPTTVRYAQQSRRPESIAAASHILGADRDFNVAGLTINSPLMFNMRAIIAMKVHCHCLLYRAAALKAPRHAYFWFELPRRCSSFRFMNMNLVEAKNSCLHLQCQGQNPRFSANQNGDDTCERKFSPCSLFL